MTAAPKKADISKTIEKQQLCQQKQQLRQQQNNNQQAANSKQQTASCNRQSPGYVPGMVRGTSAGRTDDLQVLREAQC